MLPRLFSLSYPGGRAGVGLLLLRGAVGLSALAQGGVYLCGREDSALWARAAGLLAVAAGSALLVGFLTPFACILLGLNCAASAFSSSPAHALDLLQGGLFLLIVVGMAAAAALLGPGAYSLDARLFGRREIIIPQTQGPHKP